MSKLQIDSVLQDFDHDWLIVCELIEIVSTSLDELLPTIRDSQYCREDRRCAMHAARGVVGNWVSAATTQELRELESAFGRDGTEALAVEFQEMIEEISRDICALRATAGSI